jgi:serine/threonine protein kinase
MAEAHDCSSSGLDKGPTGAGQVTHFLSATRSFQNRELQNDATTSSTGEHTYYSTAPQELWTEILPKDLQDQNFASITHNREGESSCVEVHLLGESDLLLLSLLAEGGQAHVYSAECEKFSTPVVVKRLKHGNVDLFRLQRRMEMVMKIRKKNNSAICRVFGVGVDFVGNAWVVMERMAGDLRTLIDRRMTSLEVGQMPFDYNNTITMMMHIAQGMEDLHRCDLIHADLKASNILVTPVIMDPEGEKGDGSQRAVESMYFYVNIGDFETSDGVVGTGFWRAPEVLQAVKNETKPILSRAADVYSYGMLCYELLTGNIPFEGCARTDYDVVLSGKRPKLPAYVNLTMKQLLHACWLKEPRKRPGWTWIVKTLKDELVLHQPGSQQPKRRAQPRIERERREIQNEVPALSRSVHSSPWLVAAVQRLGVETFDTWQKKVLREAEPVVIVFSELKEAFRQDPYSRRFLNPEPTFWEANSTLDKVLCAFDEIWQLVKETWADHVKGGSRLEESVTEVIDGSDMETLEESQIVAKRETERTVWEMWANEVLEPYNLLGPTAEDWLKKVLASSKEWEVFRATLDAWHTENQNSFGSWQYELQKSSSAWKKVCDAIHSWHVEGPTAFIVWQILKKVQYAFPEMEYYILRATANHLPTYDNFLVFAEHLPKYFPKIDDFLVFRVCVEDSNFHKRHHVS